MSNDTSIDYHLPWAVPWEDVDPSRHAFNSDRAREVIATATVRSSTRFPAAWRDDSTPDRSSNTNEGRIRRDRDAWVRHLHIALRHEFGPWTWGWLFSNGTTALLGRNSQMPCCLNHFVTTPEETADKTHRALCEWRRWLEELADLFDTLALPAAQPPARLIAWEHAVTAIVSTVVDRTEASDAWYGHCTQVLEWFLGHQGVPRNLRHQLVAGAIGGRFGSWSGPDPEIVADVAAALAVRASHARATRPGSRNDRRRQRRDS